MDTIGIKHKIAASVAPAVRFGMWWAPGFRRTLWRSVANSKLDLRPAEVTARAHFGARFDANLADANHHTLYYFGFWKPQVEAVVSHMLQPGDTFIDVGANIGYFSLLGATRVGSSGQVFAVEASARTFERLTANIARNNAEAVIRAIHAAVADRAGMLVLFARSERKAGGESKRGMTSLPRQEDSAAETVPAQPLGQLIPREALHRARLVKVAVEGAEHTVLAGMEPDLDRMSADVLMELSPALTSAGRILDLLAASGRLPYRVLPEDSLENYFSAPLLPRVQRMTDIPDKRTDVLFTRRSPEELKSAGICCD